MTAIGDKQSFNIVSLDRLLAAEANGMVAQVIRWRTTNFDPKATVGQRAISNLQFKVG